jgi:hypothetical protein
MVLAAGVSPPPKQLLRRQTVSPRNRAHRRSISIALGDDLRLLLVRPCRRATALTDAPSRLHSATISALCPRVMAPVLGAARAKDVIAACPISSGWAQCRACAPIPPGVIAVEANVRQLPSKC